MKTINIILGVGAVALILMFNLRHAINEYGLLENSLALQIVAQTNSSNDGGGSSDGGGTTGGDTSGGDTSGGDSGGDSGENSYPKKKGNWEEVYKTLIGSFKHPSKNMCWKQYSFQEKFECDINGCQTAVCNSTKIGNLEEPIACNMCSECKVGG
jgi:hypothetical protein